MSDYIFGYGSLISSLSREKTGETGKAVPVRVRGIQRSWNLVVPQLRMSAVGAVRELGAICTGVLVPVPEGELPKFDARELPYGYARSEIGTDEIDYLWGGRIPKGTMWVYTTENPATPTEEAPIVQSYVDVMLHGCLTFWIAFAEEFVLTTKGWEAPWIDDRNVPRYPRAINDLSGNTIRRIDGIFKRTVPAALAKRKVG